MEYLGYQGDINFSKSDRMFFGKVKGIQSLLSYEGRTIDKLEEDFHKAIDDYLAFCKEKGISPEVP